MKAALKTFVAGLIPAAVIFAGVAAGLQAAEPLATATVKMQPVARERLLDGIVEAVRETTVSAETTGRVSAILVDVDDFVKQGDIIVRFVDTEQRASLARAKAALDGARANARRAQQNFSRISRLFKKRTVARAKLDEARADNTTARSLVASAQATLNKAREQLAYTVVRAPYSGIVKKRHIEAGELAVPGKPLISGFSLDELRVRVDVPQALIAAIRERPRANVIRPGDDKQPVKAVRVTVFAFANPASNTFTVRLYMPRKIKGLLPGMLVTAAFVTGERTSFAIPEKAIVQRGELSAVYVVAGGRVILRQIQPGARLAGGAIEVLSGLARGEAIALDPVRAALQRASDNANAKAGAGAGAD